MKNLRFQEASNNINLIPYGVTPRMEDNSDGRGLRQVGVMVQGYTRQLDRNEWTKLQIRKEDLNDCLQALQWSCGDLLDFVFTPIKSPNSSIAEIHLPGRFIPTLTIENVAQIVADYRLLSREYARRQDIFSQKSNENLSTILFNYLLDKVEGRSAELPEWTHRALDIRKENQKEML